LGSVQQGFVTQAVTKWLNLLGGVAVAGALLQGVVDRGDPRRRWVLGLAGVLLVAEVGLVALHGTLSGMIDAENLVVPDGPRFYQWHRAYLVLTTVQWAAGLVWMALYVARLADAPAGRGR
jgi:hypothetical protein